jgi:predicted nucleic acid-binding protein
LNVFVDTSVWSLALRRDALPDIPAVDHLWRSLEIGAVYCTGLVLQELLQGFTKPKAHRQIVSHFSAIPLLTPDRDDHIHAAELRNLCRRKGIRTGTFDTLLAQLCTRYDLTMLSTDKEFRNMATTISLSVWQPDTS